MYTINFNCHMKLKRYKKNAWHDTENVTLVFDWGLAPTKKKWTICATFLNNVKNVS